MGGASGNVGGASGNVGGASGNVGARECVRSVGLNWGRGAAIQPGRALALGSGPPATGLAALPVKARIAETIAASTPEP